MKLPAINLNQQTLSQFGEALTKEWLITNGLGGYSSSTVLGINTRKYHGLLVAALHPPGNRTVCLSKLDEDFHAEGTVYRLGANEFHNTVYPQGNNYLKEFELSPFPTYTYDTAAFAVTKKVFMHKEKNATSTIYNVANKGNSAAKFKVYPLLSGRYFHNVVDRWKNPPEFTLQKNDRQIDANFHDHQAALSCRVTDGEFKEKFNWIEKLFYREEAARGESSFDDCFSPGFFELDVPANVEVQFAVTATASHESQVNREFLEAFGSSLNQVIKAYKLEMQSKASLIEGFYRLNKDVPESNWLNWVLLSADSFIVENQSKQKAIIAGYFWFEPWGRDSLIALPGLMLTTSRFSDAKDVLENYSGYCKNGLIPNFIVDRSGEPVYNTVDGTLWYVNALLQYLKYTGDFDFVKEKLWQTLKSIIHYHEKGTSFGIHLDSDGLLMHGSRLTWMDALVEGTEITPRAGKAVEIQALWYNTLKVMEILANKFSEPNLAEKYRAMAEKTKTSFNKQYWNQNLSCLYDVLDANGADASMRPNQIFTASLDFTMLDRQKSESVVNAVYRDLFTPYGLRTLALDDPKFVGKCEGDRRTRDTAYHNGTIWPWLLGPFVTAYIKVKGNNAATRKFANDNFVQPLFTIAINQAGLGTVSEIFDCEAPNKPRGCIAQAWSIAEPLRAYVEDVLQVKPKYEKTVLKS
jgi:predicted glycogen debranching enzyme